MSMNFAETIRRFATGTYTVTRTEPQTYINGRVTEPVTSTFALLAFVHPLSGRELERLPEGLRTSEVLAVVSVEALKTQGKTQAPDTIQIDEDNYQVERVDPWKVLGNFFRALVRKV